MLYLPGIAQRLFETGDWSAVFWRCSAAAAKSLQSCPTLCDPIDGSPPGSLIPGIVQARTLEWVAISFSNAWRWKVKVKSLQSCLTLSDPMDCSPPGSSVHGIFQARVLEWGVIEDVQMVSVLTRPKHSLYGSDWCYLVNTYNLLNLLEFICPKWP